jgi:hypothetical protein
MNKTALVGSLLLACLQFPQHATASDRIQPCDRHPHYWQYKGEPVLLVGGSDDDSLFNFNLSDGLESHLDLLASVGGNYIRNTMSSRDPGAVWAFRRLGSGRYDLAQWNSAYWDRFEGLLKLARERNIIVQLEIWDPWDYFYDSTQNGSIAQGGWSKQPFNPVNNVNYDASESNLKTEIDYPSKDHPTDHNFFHTVPALENNKVVLKFQEAFVDKILAHSLSYPNVLYCLSNEIGEPLEWSVYWAMFIRRRARERDVKVQVAEMRRANDINSGDHKFLQDHPEIFSFLDISQNNGGSNWERPEQRHWAPVIELRKYIADLPRPINNTKVYGSGSDSRGGQEQALQKFWRSIFAGCASARFHRPPSGLGLSETAQTQIRSMRMLTDEFRIFSTQPRNDLLDNRQPNEAYCLADPGSAYAIYFTDGGEVTLDLSAANGQWQRRWLAIGESNWKAAESFRANDRLNLKAPGGGQWVLVLLPSVN